MNVGAFPFLIFLAALAVVFQLLQGKARRQTLFVAANVAFLLPFVSNPQSWVALGFPVGDGKTQWRHYITEASA